MQSAEAVFDLMAPPARQAPTRATEVARTDAPSFEDHLQAAAHEPPVIESGSSAQSSDTKPAPALSSHDAAEALLDGLSVAPVVPPAPPTPPVQLTVVQLIAAPDAAVPAADLTQPVAAAPSLTPDAPLPTSGASAPGPSAPTMPSAAQPTPSDARMQQAPPSSVQNNGAREHSASSWEATANTVLPAAPTTSPAMPASSTASNGAPPVLTLAINSSGQAPPSALTKPSNPIEPARAARAAFDREAIKTDSPPPDQSLRNPTPTAAPKASVKSPTLSNAIAESATPLRADAPDAAQPQPQPSAPPAPPAHAQQTQADLQNARTAPAVHQVSREIVRRFEGGGTRFELRLDPPELGRVEVRLDVSRDHRVTAVIAADNAQALTELARNARELEQMLERAGLELSDSGLSFDLRQRAEAAGAFDLNGVLHEDTAPIEEVAALARPLGYERWRGLRVDMMV